DYHSLYIEKLKDYLSSNFFTFLSMVNKNTYIPITMVRITPTTTQIFPELLNPVAISTSLCANVVQIVNSINANTRLIFFITISIEFYLLYFLINEVCSESSIPIRLSKSNLLQLYRILDACSCPYPIHQKLSFLHYLDVVNLLILVGYTTTRPLLGRQKYCRQLIFLLFFDLLLMHYAILGRPNTLMWRLQNRSTWGH